MNKETSELECSQCEKQILKFKWEPNVCFEDGYYFKGRLLSKYKLDSIDILRKRVTKAGAKVGESSLYDLQRGKVILNDEYQIVYQHFLKIKKRVKQAHKTKLPFYAKNRIMRKREKIKRLQEEIRQEKELLKELKP